MGNDNKGVCCAVNQITPTAQFDLQNLVFKDLDFNKAETYKKLEKQTKQFLKKQNLSEQYVPLISRIIANKQQHLIQAYKSYSTQKQKQRFLKNLQCVDIQLVDSLFHNLINKNNKINRSSFQMIAKPCSYVQNDMLAIQKKNKLFNRGLQIISQRKIAILLLCGGNSVRFKQKAPKFLYQTNLPSKKCILQILLLRLKKINNLANKNNDWSIQIFLMCNQDNYQHIKGFLQKNKYCGIPQKSIHFLLQSTIPILNLKGQLCLNKDLKVIQSPNGTGQFLQTIINFKMKNKIMNQLGIQYLYISGLQNLLQIPCDPLLIGQMVNQNSQVIAKCTDIENANQRFYRYVNINGKIKSLDIKRLQDYICPDLNKLQKSPIYMNSVIYETSYLNKLLINPQIRFQISRIFHCDKRPFTYVDVRQKKNTHENQNCYVFEKNLSDLFLAAQNVVLVKVNRQQQFAPVISKNEQYSLKQAQKLLLNFHQNLQKNIPIQFSMFTKQQITST